MKNSFFGAAAKLSTVVALLATSGCAEYNRRVLTHMEDQGPEFSKTLSKEYESLGNTEQRIMYDEWSADYYYCKAIWAKRGYPVWPTPLNKWTIEEDKIPELAAAHDRLIRALQSGAPEVAPKMTAYAQAHFDCWVEQEAEGWQIADIALCRAEFYSSMAEVELMLMGGAHQVAPGNMVFFDFNSAFLNADGMREIDVVSRMASAESPRHILLVGRTDQVGDAKHNKDLSKERAMAVKDALIRHGVPADRIAIKAAGEAPGPKIDMHNRRVDIIFLQY